MNNRFSDGDIEIEALFPYLSVRGFERLKRKLPNERLVEQEAMYRLKKKYEQETGIRMTLREFSEGPGRDLKDQLVDEVFGKSKNAVDSYNQCSQVLEALSQYGDSREDIVGNIAVAVMRSPKLLSSYRGFLRQQSNRSSGPILGRFHSEEEDAKYLNLFGLRN